MSRSPTYLVVNDGLEHTISMKTLASLDFVALSRTDGSYAIYKNRFDQVKEFKNTDEFLDFFNRHLRNDPELSPL